MAKWFGSKTDPIGIDVGRSSVKLAQVASAGNQPRLTASATIEVPESLRNSSTGPLEMFREALDKALSGNGFRGRRVVIGLPASCVHIDRLRLPPSLDDEQTRQAVAWESIDRFPFPAARAMLRHVVAGEVYDNEERRSEVIVMAVRNELTEALLAAAARAKLDVIGLMPEPQALLGGFARGGGGPARTRAVIDVGHGATRLYIARGTQMQFARSMGIGWSHLNAGDGPASEKVRDDEAGWRDDRIRDSATAVLDAPTGRPAIAVEPMRRLMRELSLSCHYHAETFPASPIDDVLLVGGAAAQRALSEPISAVLNFPVQRGNPLSPDANQSAWAVAIGLSLVRAA